MNRTKTLTLTVVALFTLAACDTGTSSDSTDKEQATADAQLDQFLVAQPVPQFNWSQLRQNLIEIETAQAETTATTSFFFNMGIPDPIMSCPSIGFPIAATYQLTNPGKAIEVGVSGKPNPAVVLDQLEATGVYTADTTGTYVICIDSGGSPYAFYWEGFVSSVTGPAEWIDGKIVLTGDPSFDFTVGEN